MYGIKLNHVIQTLLDLQCLPDKGQLVARHYGGPMAEWVERQNLNPVMLGLSFSTATWICFLAAPNLNHQSR